ncbi:MAG: hypothetical protein ACXABY_19985 [Candidatus Thorarchaeota archaeon]|jgi:hypothetical protein
MSNFLKLKRAHETEKADQLYDYFCEDCKYFNYMQPQCKTIQGGIQSTYRRKPACQLGFELDIPGQKEEQENILERFDMDKPTCNDCDDDCSHDCGKSCKGCSH